MTSVDVDSNQLVLTKFREYALGPMRFMNLVSCFELGIIDLLRRQPDSWLTAIELADATGATAEAVQQLMLLLVKEDFVAYDEETRSYALERMKDLTDADYDRLVPWLHMIKVVCLRQLYYLTESIRGHRVIGLKEFYDFDGNFYQATTKHDDLRAAWASMMERIARFSEPWFNSHVDVPPGAKVLDLVNDTDFVGGSVLESVPKGFDVIVIKHFLGMLDKEHLFRVFQETHRALEVGGQVYALVPIYQEDVKSSWAADFFPAYFLGCTAAEGGPQKLSVYKEWMEACGFEVTKAISQDINAMPADVVPVHGILCGTKR